MRKDTLRFAGTSALVWLLAVLALNPSGEFPMMDDWIYGRAVRTWIADGHLLIPSNTQMVALGHLAWGAAVALVFGFSFQTLHIATLIIGWLGLVAVYCAIRDAGAPAWVAWLGAATLFANPIYLVLSSTYMTDVPFFVLSTLSLRSFICAIRHGRRRHILAAAAWSACALVVRQPGIVLPAAFVVAFPAARGCNRRSALEALVPFAVTAAALLTFELVMRHARLLPADYNLPLRTLVSGVQHPSVSEAVFTAERLLNMAFHLGLFMLPFVLAVGRIRNTRRSSLLAAIGAFLIVLIAGKAAPWGSSLLYDTGVGGLALTGAFEAGSPSIPHAPRWMWMAVTLASAVAAVHLTGEWVAALRDALRKRAPIETRGIVLLAALGTIACLVPYALSWFYDRYLLALVPCLMLYAGTRDAAPGITKVRAGLVAIALAAYLSFAAAAGHDYYAWNRARWSAIADLMNAGVPASDIDGGSEFAGLYRFTPDDDSWRTNPDARYAIAFGPLPNHRIVRTLPYSRWLFADTGAIQVLERTRGT